MTSDFDVQVRSAQMALDALMRRIKRGTASDVEIERISGFLRILLSNAKARTTGSAVRP